ncbi:MAG TPA: hypothetical protein VGM37_00420 [Armatimonadota bacterium]|jgi:hypothetical protein
MPTASAVAKSAVGGNPRRTKATCTKAAPTQTATAIGAIWTTSHEPLARKTQRVL